MGMKEKGVQDNENNKHDLKIEVVSINCSLRARRLQSGRVVIETIITSASLQQSLLSQFHFNSPFTLIVLSIYVLLVVKSYNIVDNVRMFM